MLQGGDPGTVLPRYPSLNKLNKCGQLIVIICLTVNYSKTFTNYKVNLSFWIILHFTSSNTNTNTDQTKKFKYKNLTSALLLGIPDCWVF